jgi:LPXTG-motif cell wall-anchored protein
MSGAQIAMATLFFISLLLSARDHGKPKTGADNFWVALLGVGILAAILWWGGFWRLH